MNQVLIVAKKELADHLTSKRFIALFALIIIISANGIISGVKDYNKQMQYYTTPTGSVSYTTPTKPSIVNIYNRMALEGFMVLGGFLSILMGFDLITKEKESGSLKTLLSHPVFRDSIINGKTIGAFAALGCAVFFVILLSLGILAFYGIIPTLKELLVITGMGFITLAYLFTFFAISMFASTISKNSGMALMISFGLILLFTAFIPFIGTFVAQAVVGPPPPPPPPIPIEGGKVIQGGGIIDKGEVNTPPPNMDKIRQQMEEYERINREYYKKRNEIMNMFQLLSPQAGYMQLTAALSNLLQSNIQYSPYGETGSINKYIMSFILFPVVFFVLSYIRFLRMEIT